MKMWSPWLLAFSVIFSSALASPPPVYIKPQTTPPTTTEVEEVPKECAKGEKFWCQNVLTAKNCKAVTHCTQSVWQTRKLDVDESPRCLNCEKYVESVKEALANNVTIEQAKIILDSMCSIAQYFVAKECMLIVSKTLPEIQSYIDSVEPHSFCSTILLCNNVENKLYFDSKGIKTFDSVMVKSTSTTEKPTTAEPTKTGLTCNSCYTLFTTGKHVFEKTPRDEVLKTMIKLCGELSSFSDGCSSFVISTFEDIYKRLSSVSVGEFCHLSGTCDQLYHFHETPLELETAIALAPKEPNDETCDFCVAMVKHLRDILVSNSTESEFKQVLEGICKQTGSYAQECLDAVDQYYAFIYGFLITELNGDELCKEIGICKNKDNKIEFLAPMIPVNLKVPLIGADEVNAAKSQEDKDKSELHRVKLTGTQTVVNPNKILLGASRCTWGPEYWCKNMQTTRECGGHDTLKLCIPKWEKTVLPVDNGDICNICKDMVKQARDQLNSNETQEELKEVFEGSCKLIPVKIARNECIKAVDDFIPELVDTLSSQMNPQIVCATVGLCNSAKMDLLYEKGMAEMTKEEMAPLPLDRMFPVLPTSVNVNNEVAKRGKEACEMCELFLHYVQQQITLPASESEIKKVVKEVCIKMPNAISTQCTSFIDVYGDDFIALLAQRIDPSQVCPSIGACAESLHMIDSVKPTCPLCMLAVESLQNALANNKTEENIRNKLDTLCSHLSSDMKSECDRFVAKFTEQLIDAILADFSREEICAYLKLCPASVISSDVEMHHEIEHHEIVHHEKITAGNVDTNEVALPKETEEGVEGKDNKCVLCEFIMSKLAQELEDKKTEDEIKHEIHVICEHMPHSVKDKCDAFIMQYADLIFKLLAASMDPEQVCTELKFCDRQANITELKSKIEFHQIESTQQVQMLVIYSGLCLVALVCIMLVVLTAFKTRNAFTSQTPYIRVTK